MGLCRRLWGGGIKSPGGALTSVEKFTLFFTPGVRYLFSWGWLFRCHENLTVTIMESVPVTPRVVRRPPKKRALGKRRRSSESIQCLSNGAAVTGMWHCTALSMPFNGAMLTNENVLASLETLTGWKAGALALFEGTFPTLMPVLTRTVKSASS